MKNADFAGSLWNIAFVLTIHGFSSYLMNKLERLQHQFYFFSIAWLKQQQFSCALNRNRNINKKGSRFFLKSFSLWYLSYSIYIKTNEDTMQWEKKNWFKVMQMNVNLSIYICYKRLSKEKKETFEILELNSKSFLSPHLCTIFFSFRCFCRCFHSFILRTQASRETSGMEEIY